jgi:hypothetical protein
VRLSRSGFPLERIEFDHHGHHVRKADRKANKNARERDWEKEEKGLDTSLTARLMRRSLAADHPDGFLVMAGDADYASVLQSIMRENPGMAVGVAAFRRQLAACYWPRNALGFHWHAAPILLDKLLASTLRDKQSAGPAVGFVQVA